MYRHEVTDVFNIHVDWHLLFDETHLDLRTDAEGRMHLLRLVDDLETFTDAFDRFVEGVLRFHASLTKLDKRQSAMIGVREEVKQQKKKTSQLNLWKI